jgi:predicted esterase
MGSSDRQRPPIRSDTTRRRFLGLVGAAGALSLVGFRERLRATEGVRLGERPTAPTIPMVAGAQPLGLNAIRDGILFVPKAATAGAALPLVVMLHGAGNRAHGVAYTFAIGEELGAVVLAPDSRGSTWDAVRGSSATWPGDVEKGPDAVDVSSSQWYGPDVAFIDRALKHTFARCPIDPARLALAGFSDGASYALSLGISNGDLFRSIVAFSPGFIPAVYPQSKPRIFVSHGTRDRILPIDLASRTIVPQLKEKGYDVTYREFDGEHRVPPEIGREGFSWVLKR